MTHSDRILALLILVSLAGTALVSYIIGVLDGLSHIDSEISSWALAQEVTRRAGRKDISRKTFDGEKE